MKSRLVASAALSALVLLGATGCTFITPQATEIQYNPADGVSADFGPLKVRDALVITDDEGVRITHPESGQRGLQVETTNGGRYWLFRLGDGENAVTGPMRWFIHGAFA